MKFKASSHSQKGIALVITLIMLAITLVMAVAFLALAKRERSSVSTSTDTTTARLASDTAAANAEAQIIANVLGSFNGLGSSNAYNLSLLVSTNYINPYGFNPGIGNPTNVSYTYANGNPLSVADLEQNISNLWFLPRAPVFVPTNSAFTGYDFRYYLDLNQNGRYDTNYFGQDVDSLGQPLAGLPYLHTGDPEWIGVLEHPDAPHGPNNHFVSRYAFIAVPIGNTLDINYIHNQARNPSLTPANSDGYMRNQGVGSWELNLAAFLADLNTNEWGAAVGSQSGSPLYYQYNEPQSQNLGRAFDDARALLRYRYNNFSLPSAGAVLFNAPFVFPHDQIDAYSDGPLQTTLDANSDQFALGTDGDILPAATSWSGANNVNYYFTLGDLLDTAKVGGGANSFPGRLANAGSAADTYDRYTYYRMLNQLGTDSTPDEGKLNLNYSNAVVSYVTVNNAQVPLGINVVAGAETNLVPWAPQNFFNAAADRMLRTYSANWFQSSPSNFLVTYYGALPRGYLDATGMGVTNFPNYGVTNQVPAFGLTNIPVLINSNFVYSPAVNRLLQLAANLYDATTNGNFNLPHVFRPIFEHDTVGNVFIVGYTNLYSSNGPNTVSGPGDTQLATPRSISELPSLNAPYEPIRDPATLGLVNVYGVPWIIGAKKGLPNFNQFYMLNNAQITRKLLISRTPTDPATATYTTNQMYSLGISNTLGVTFWNSYSNAYPRPVAIYVHDSLSEVLTNSTLSLGTAKFNINGAIENSWPGSQWSGVVPKFTLNSASFVNASWSTNYLYNTITYVAANTPLAFPTILWTSPGLIPFTQVGLMITNYLQAYLLDGNNVIDYVQLRDPISVGNLNQALADPDYVQQNNIFYQWSVNPAAGGTPWGVANQLEVSGNPDSAPAAGGTWNKAPTPEGITTPDAEAAFYRGFFTPTYLGSDGQTYVNNQPTIQAPYTPSRTVFSSYLLQANDPLVHYLSSDLNAQPGTVAIWDGKQQWTNGVWNHVDDLLNQPLPSPPGSPIGGRYQPWLQPGQMDMMSALKVVSVTNNYACKDPLVEHSDNWDFPTNAYPSVGWIGRVHRGTPWQTIYLKDYDLTKAYNVAGRNILYVGTNTWANWTGDIQQNFGQYYDAANYAPVQDRLLFDIFTTRFNDNAAHGTLPVNQTGLAAWSAVFSGMVAMTNNAVNVFSTTPLSYTNLIINPAGVMNPSLADQLQPLLWRIVNGTNGINATRANTNLFPYHAFTRVGDILATPALTTNLFNLGTQVFGYQQVNFGINDEEYEWLPQHLMGLVRMSAPRYALYCLGQALRPAPNGTVLSGSYALLVTNYQVVAESAERVVIRVDNANSYAPHVVVESSNVLPPN